MKYRKRSRRLLNVTKSQLIAENSNTSLPKAWTADTLEFLGVDPVLAGAKPTLGDYEVARELTALCRTRTVTGSRRGR